MATTVEKYIAAIVAEGDVQAFRNAPDLTPLLQFCTPQDQALWAMLDEYVREFKQMPSASLLKAEGWGLPPADGASGYHFKKCEEQHLKRGMAQLANGIGESLQNTDPVDLLESARQAVRELGMSRLALEALDFRHGLKIMENKWAEQASHSLTLGWPTLDEMMAGARAGDRIDWIARPKMGKFQRLTEPVLLANGYWKAMGDLKIGDALASTDGAPSRVTGVYPQGVQASYRVTFKDGRTTEAGLDHLWKVSYRDWPEARVLKTSEIMTLLEKKRYQGRLWVELISGKFGDGPTRLDPYVLGVILGDGCLRTPTPRITSMDSQVLARVRSALPNGHVLSDISSGSSGKASDFSIIALKGPNLITQALRAWGLMGGKSEDKFIPPYAFTWSRESRLALLQGLLDTDGEAGKSGNILFGSSSRKLFDDVRRLVWSLGGQATCQKPKATTHLDHFRMSIRVPDRGRAFHLDRKRNRVGLGGLKNPERLVIESVGYVEDAESQCISVSHPSCLYVTRDYLPTHNTYLLAFSALHVWKTQELPVLFVSNEMVPEMIIERWSALHTSTPAHILKSNQWPATKGDFAGKQSQNKMKKGFYDKMHMVEVGGVPLWCVGGNLGATVADVLSLAEKLGACMVYDDGAYMHSVPQEPHPIRKVPFIVQDLKKGATDLGIPLGASWQFTKDAAASKLKPGEQPGLEHIAHSEDIGRATSCAMGLFQAEGIETKLRRRVNILAGRSGEVGEFEVGWDFTSMNLSEINEDNPLTQPEYMDIA